MPTKKRPIKRLVFSEGPAYKRLRYNAEERLVYISSHPRKGKSNKVDLTIKGSNLDRVIVWLQQAYLFDERP